MLSDAILLKPDVQQLHSFMQSVAPRRLLPVPDMLRRISPMLAARPKIYSYVDEDVVLLALLPAAEMKLFKRRLNRFGTAFPGLYAAGDEGFSGKDEDEPRLVDRENSFMIAGSKGSMLTGTPILDLRPDASFSMERHEIGSGYNGGGSAKYLIYLLLGIRFGKRLTHNNAAYVMDDLAVMHVRESRRAAGWHPEGWSLC